MAHRVPRRSVLKLAGGSLLAAPAFSPLAGVMAAQTSTGTPKIILNVRDFGATGDGMTKDTAAIQQALDRCAVFGRRRGAGSGGQLSYRRDRAAVEYDSAAGKGRQYSSASPDFADYPVTQVRWEGKWIQGRVGLIYAIGANHIGVVGPGQDRGQSRARRAAERAESRCGIRR